MPGPCDPGSPRELQDGTNTLGPVLQWPEEQEGRKGEEAKATGPPCYLLPCFLLMSFLSLSPEPPVVQSTASKPGFSSTLTTQRDSPSAFTPTQSPNPPDNKGPLQVRRTASLIPASLTLRSAFPGAWAPPGQACLSPLSRKDHVARSCG